jgi:hypothetical protein
MSFFVSLSLPQHAARCRQARRFSAEASSGVPLQPDLGPYSPRLWPFLPLCILPADHGKVVGSHRPRWGKAPGPRRPVRAAPGPARKCRHFCRQGCAQRRLNDLAKFVSAPKRSSPGQTTSDPSPLAPAYVRPGRRSADFQRGLW